MTSADREGGEQRVLVLAPTSKDADLTRSILERAGVGCHCCADLTEICRELEPGAGAVLLAEEAVAPDRNSCLDNWLASQPRWSDLPILILARLGADSAAVARSMDLLGNVTVLERPTRVASLVSAVRTALRARGRQYEARAHLSQIERSEGDLRDFFDNASVGLHWVGPDGIILRVNQTELDLLGYTREEYVGRHIAEFHVDQPVIVELLERLAAGETIQNYAARLRCKDRSIKHVLINSNVLWEDGRFIHTRCFTRDITDHKQAAEVQARLAAIVASSADAIISKTLDGIILTWNAGAERLFGYSAEEVISKPVTLLIPPERLDEEQIILGRLRRGERIEHFETVRIAKDRRLIDISLTVSPIRDAAGAVIGASKVARDITKLKRAEQALRETGEQLAAELADSKLLQGLSAALIHEDNVNALYGKLMDAAVAIMHSDFASMQMLYPERGVPGTRGELRLLAHHGFNPETAKFWEWVRADSGCSCGEALRTSARCIVADVAACEFMMGTEDRTAYLQAGIHAVQSTPLISRSGKLLGMISTHWRQPHQPLDRDLRLLDVLARQAADLIERVRSEQSLRESEERFRLMADAVPVLIWVSDVSKACTWFNKWWLDFSGRPMRELVGDGWAQDVHPDDMARCLHEYSTHFDARQPFCLEYRLRRHDGEYRWLVDNGVPRFDSAGKFMGYIGSCVDFTERIRMEDALRDADRRKDEFLAVLAHELRNPLAPIRNSLHILRMTAQHDPAAERVGEMLERQVNHMVRLVDDLMEVSRITRGKIELRKEPIEVAAIIRSAVETSRPLIDAAGHNLALAIPPEPLVLNGDPVRLAQVVTNLLNNSAKYTEPGGQIWLTVRREAQTVAISVRDTGGGIPLDMLPRVFELFTQVDRHANRAQGGLGIGLALVKSLVEMHGGSVDVHSKGIGQGSEFVVRLPLSTARLHPDAPDKDAASADKPAARRILVVDDNRDAANSLGMLLKFIGADVRTAYNGPDALEAFATWKPAVVLLDIGMPGMDGYEVARRIRGEPDSEDVMLIALTGWGQEEDRNRSKSAGFDHHMIKPPEFSTLKSLLMSVDERRRTAGP